MTPKVLITCVFSILCSTSNLARADDDPPVQSVAPASNETQIADWIQQLDSPKFSKRVEASRKLRASKLSAIAPLGRAALHSNAEISQRSLDILREHFRLGAETEKKAAKEVLLKLSRGDHSVSRKARAILDPPPDRPVQICGHLRIQMKIVKKGCEGKHQIATTPLGR